MSIFDNFGYAFGSAIDTVGKEVANIADVIETDPPEDITTFGSIIVLNYNDLIKSSTINKIKIMEPTIESNLLTTDKKCLILVIVIVTITMVFYIYNSYGDQDYIKTKRKRKRRKRYKNDKMVFSKISKKSKSKSVHSSSNKRQSISDFEPTMTV